MNGQPSQQQDSNPFISTCIYIVCGATLFQLVRAALAWWASLGEWTQFFGKGALISLVAMVALVAYAIWSSTGAPEEDRRSLFRIKAELDVAQAVLPLLFFGLVICLVLASLAHRAEQSMVHGQLNFWRDILR
ncbi:MAG: hypothetical protein U0136_03755 [Bdellovibrionota bacterium]